MPIELTPSAAARDVAVVRSALEAVGIPVDPAFRRPLSAWARAALREAVENEPVGPRYAPSPRNTRGATRA